MLDEDQPSLIGQAADQGQQPTGGGRIQIGQRLVEHEQSRGRA